MDVEALTRTLTPVLPEGAIITDHQRLRTYECDGLAQYRVVPALVVIPETAEQPREFDGVGDQVLQELAQQHRIGTQ